MNSEFEMIIKEIRGLEYRLTNRIDGLENKVDNLEVKFNSLETKFEDLKEEQRGLAVHMDRIEINMNRRFDDVDKSLMKAHVSIETGANKLGYLCDGYEAAMEKITKVQIEEEKYRKGVDLRIAKLENDAV